MEISPYLNFNGQCAAAFKFYEQVLGGKIVMMQTHGESPLKDQVPADWRDKIIHVRLTVGDNVLMGSDAPPSTYAAPQGGYVSISVPSPADAERIFIALAENGNVTMPFQKTSGPPVSAWPSIGSALRGWSTPSKRPDPFRRSSGEGGPCIGRVKMV